MMYTYCAVYNLPYTTASSDYKEYQVFIEKQRRADIDSRLRALALAMNKKKTTDGYSEKKLTI